MREFPTGPALTPEGMMQDAFEQAGAKSHLIFEHGVVTSESWQQVMKEIENHKQQQQINTFLTLAGALVLVIILGLIGKNWSRITSTSGTAFVYIASRFYKTGMAVSRRKTELAERIKDAAKS